MAHILVLVLMLGGVGRALMAVPDVPDPTIVIGGTAVPICHSYTGNHADPTDPAVPADPAHGDCCDACALATPVLVPTPPQLAWAQPVELEVSPPAAAAAAPYAARIHTPRQSRGPPLA
jgi:hypothetical protein